MYRLIILITDIDECSDGSDDCDDNAVCTNTDGSFTCVCESGYTGNGRVCEGKLSCKELSVYPIYICTIVVIITFQWEGEKFTVGHQILFMTMQEQILLEN